MKQLTFLTLISFLTLIFGCSNQTKNAQEVDNKIDGFHIPLPQNWIDNSQFDLKDNLSKFELSGNEITNLLKTHNGSVPVVMYTKYDPSEYAGPMPTIQVNLRPNNNKDFDSFKDDMKKSMSQMGGYFSNFKIIEPLDEIVIDGVKGVWFISQFDLPGQQGEIWTIRSWSYGFPSGNFFYQINFSDTENENSEDIYNDIMNEVNFRK